MIKKEGMHLYINIVNYSNIILDEEKKTGQVTHAIHALDTFFSMIELYGKRKSKLLSVEKITGSRLHLYIVDDLLPSIQIVKQIAAYSFSLSQYINADNSKYRSLIDFEINIGADYGEFYDFEFVADNSFSEKTTIGYAANYAAKLQACSGINMLSISDNIYRCLTQEEKKEYRVIYDSKLKKYKQDKYYTIYLAKIERSTYITEQELEMAKDYAYSSNLGDIEFSGIKKPLDFHSLSKTQCKKLYGIPVYADVRGFTCLFDKNDNNLDEMAQKTQEILESMYRVNICHGGVHVQFQGDRELSLYHDIPAKNENGNITPEIKCFKSAVLASMRMIDAVKPYSVHIGVGEDYGILFATKLGARGEKDNILLGETVIRADKMEDEYAGEDQIVITVDVYEGLFQEDKTLANQFKKAGNYYFTTIGYKEYTNIISYQQLKYNTTHNNYNGAWGII